MLRIADEEASHLGEIIDNALDMAHLDNDHIDVDLEDSRLDEEVHAVITSMDKEIGERQLIIESARQLAPVRIDRRLLKLAIKQIVNNALKYSPAKEPVALRLVNGNGTVALEVTDHGHGIPEEERVHIFERFYRSPSVETKTTGSGLGLSIAQRILQAHKGALTVESRPGQTTFRLTLPVESDGTK
jgi:two-component system sensor histidine kinase KdpD